jgi:phage-related minor tail protein
MAADAKLIIQILTDAKSAVSGINDAKKAGGGFNDTMRGLVAPAGIALGAITALGAGAVDAASSLEQSVGGVEAVFGSSASQIETWAKTASDSVGLSERAYNEFAAVVGAQLKNMGLPMDQVLSGTDDLISKGADLAAAFGGSTTDAVNALSSALRGEADPAERYGLSLKKSAINAKLAEQGLDGLTGEARTAAEAQAILALATEQMGGAVGQAGREMDTVAGQQQKLAAKTEEAAAALGTQLLPILAPILEALGEFAGWIQENSTLVTIIIGIIGALAVAVIAYTAAQWAMNAALYANPIALIIGLVVLLVAALVALAIWIASNTEAIGKFFSDLWANIQQVAGTVAEWFQARWAEVAGFFRAIWTAVAGFFQAIWRNSLPKPGRIR